MGLWRLPGSRGVEVLPPIREVLSSHVPGLSVLKAGPVGGILDALPLRLLAVDIRGPERPAVVAEAQRLTGMFRREGFEVVADLPPLLPKVQLVRTAGRASVSQTEEAIARALPALEPLVLGGLRIEETAPEQSEEAQQTAAPAPAPSQSVEDCERYLQSAHTDGGRVVKNGLIGGALGAGLGAAGGAIAGSAGTGAGVGALAGAAVSSGYTLYDEHKKKEDARRAYQACLARNGR